MDRCLLASPLPARPHRALPPSAPTEPSQKAVVFFLCLLFFFFVVGFFYFAWLPPQIVQPPPAAAGLTDTRRSDVRGADGRKRMVSGADSPPAGGGRTEAPFYVSSCSKWISLIVTETELLREPK